MKNGLIKLLNTSITPKTVSMLISRFKFAVKSYEILYVNGFGLALLQYSAIHPSHSEGVVATESHLNTTGMFLNETLIIK